MANSARYTYSQSPSSNDSVLISVMAEGRTINYDQGWSEGSAQCPSLCLMFAHLVKTLICRNPQADCTTAKRYIFQASNLFLFGGHLYVLSFTQNCVDICWLLTGG